jgi:hypothetical protein
LSSEHAQRILYSGTCPTQLLGRPLDLVGALHGGSRTDVCVDRAAQDNSAISK